MKTYENIEAHDKKKPRVWLYKKIGEDIEARLIYQDEKSQHLNDGWRDTPAAWYNFKPLIEEETGEVPRELLDAALESIDGIVDSMNGAENLEIMEGKELDDYAERHFGLKFHPRLGDKKKRLKIKAELEGQPSKVISGKQ